VRSDIRRGRRRLILGSLDRGGRVRLSFSERLGIAGDALGHFIPLQPADGQPKLRLSIIGVDCSKRLVFFIQPTQRDAVRLELRLAIDELQAQPFEVDGQPSCFIHVLVPTVSLLLAQPGVGCRKLLLDAQSISL
jgi:hypothetical protein